MVYRALPNSEESPVKPFPRLALVAGWILALAVPAHAFTIDRHYLMTRQVLETQGVTGAARELIAFGATLPDVEGCLGSCYCTYLSWVCTPDSGQVQSRSADHFDNNVFLESIFRVNDRMLAMMNGMSAANGQSRASGIALLQFGRALHAIQDFYAHSSYLEINLPFVRSNGLASLPLWEGQPYTGVPWPIAGIHVSDLRTGYYLMPVPPGQHHHDQIAKDSPYTPEGSRTYTGFPLNTTYTYYGAVSGDYLGARLFGNSGLAPRHTLRAFNALFSDGTVFAFWPPWLGPNAIAGGAVSAQAALDFFAWVNQDSALVAMAADAERLATLALTDSLSPYPPGSLDADGLPLPNVLAVGPRDAGGAARLALAAARPNPFRDGTALRFRAAAGGRVELAVYDVVGRRVATLFDGEAGPGWTEARWEGREADGRPARAGIYLVRLSGPGGAATQRVALVR